jgi:anti-sigma factor RsiW
MKITRDVVKDLLTVYLAGEASEDTRGLVDEWLKADPELANQVERARRSELPEVPPPPPSAEKLALDRTRRRLRWRSILLGAAIYFSTLPLTVTFGRGGYRGLLLHDWASRGVALAIAAALWIGYWRMSRRLAVSGL